MTGERREYNRVAVDWPARIGRKGLGIAPARVKDVSIGGIYAVAALTIELGDNVLIELPINTTSGTKTALAHGKIMRKIALNDGRLYGYGVQFLKLDDDILLHLLTVCT